MMVAPRILYLGLYRHQSGYARAAADNILALDAAGADVACRPIYYTPGGAPYYPRLLELEQRRFASYDYLIQHVPPYSQTYCGQGGINIGSFYFETWPVPPQWVHRACLLDAQLLPCQQMVEQLRTSPGFDPATRLLVCPLPSDISRYTRSYPEVPRFQAFKAGGRFLFYTVGELTRRKNLSGLLRAFYAEFREHEPVGLVIKASQAGLNAETVAANTETTCQEVARGSKLGNPPPVFVVSEQLSEAELAALHLACDVFVQPSFGEAWSIPAFDALAFGKTPIVSDSGGYREYLSNETGWLVPTRDEPVFAENEVHAELFTGRQCWAAPDLLSLRRCLRQAYEDRGLREEKAARGLEHAYAFSYEAIGPRLLGVFAHVHSLHSDHPGNP